MAQLVVALDLDDAAQARELAALCSSERVKYVKVGMQLFYSAGPGVVAMLRDQGVDVVLDLKLHDIPNTMAQAAKALARLGASYVTVHAMAGKKGLAACVDAVGEWGCRLMAVTVLTSLGQHELNSELGVPSTVAEEVARLATLAAEVGVDGIVCAAVDAPGVKSRFGERIQVMVPGVRPAWAAAPNDQVRVATPGEAAAMGADLVVVGRPVLKAPDRRRALRLLLEELKGDETGHGA
ncbi:MAG: orotidine-5'-phosphate decarboxylase [Bacillota bacterium]